MMGFQGAQKAGFFMQTQMGQRNLNLHISDLDAVPCSASQFSFTCKMCHSENSLLMFAVGVSYSLRSVDTPLFVEPVLV